MRSRFPISGIACHGPTDHSRALVDFCQRYPRPTKENVVRHYHFDPLSVSTCVAHRSAGMTAGTAASVLA